MAEHLQAVLSLTIAFIMTNNFLMTLLRYSGCQRNVGQRPLSGRQRPPFFFFGKTQ